MVAQKTMETCYEYLPNGNGGTSGVVTQKLMVAEGAHGGTGAPLSHPPFPASPPNKQKCLAKFKKLNRGVESVARSAKSRKRRMEHVATQ